MPRWYVAVNPCLMTKRDKFQTHPFFRLLIQLHPSEQQNPFLIPTFIYLSFHSAVLTRSIVGYALLMERISSSDRFPQMTKMSFEDPIWMPNKYHIQVRRNKTVVVLYSSVLIVFPMRVIYIRRTCLNKKGNSGGNCWCLNEKSLKLSSFSIRVILLETFWRAKHFPVGTSV